jgi:hypothetical protein
MGLALQLRLLLKAGTSRMPADEQIRFTRESVADMKNVPLRRLIYACGPGLELVSRSESPYTWSSPESRICFASK